MDLSNCTHAPTIVHACTHPCIHARMHTHTHTHTHTYTHTHTHTHTQVHTLMHTKTEIKFSEEKHIAKPPTISTTESNAVTQQNQNVTDPKHSFLQLVVSLISDPERPGIGYLQFGSGATIPNQAGPRVVDRGEVFRYGG